MNSLLRVFCVLRGFLHNRLNNIQISEKRAASDRSPKRPRQSSRLSARLALESGKLVQYLHYSHTVALQRAEGIDRPKNPPGRLLARHAAAEDIVVFLNELRRTEFSGKCAYNR